MGGLLDLPPEILYQISEEVAEDSPKLDIQNLSIISKALHDICRPLVWQKLALYIDTSVQSLRNLHECLVKGYGYFVRILYLQVDLEYNYRRPREDPKERLQANARIVEACPHLRDLVIELEGEDDLDFSSEAALAGSVDALNGFSGGIALLVGAIQPLATLEEIAIRVPSGIFSSEDIRVLFSNKPTLSVVSITSVTLRDDPSNKALGRALAALPQLRSLHLEETNFPGWASFQWSTALTELQLMNGPSRMDPAHFTDLLRRHALSLVRLDMFLESAFGTSFALPALQQLAIAGIIPFFEEFPPYKVVTTLRIGFALPQSGPALSSVVSALESQSLSRLKDLHFDEWASIPQDLRPRLEAVCVAKGVRLTLL